MLQHLSFLVMTGETTAPPGIPDTFSGVKKKNCSHTNIHTCTQSNVSCMLLDPMITEIPVNECNNITQIFDTKCLMCGCSVRETLAHNPLFFICWGYAYSLHVSGCMC